MSEPTISDPIVTAVDYLRASFQPSDRVAVLVRNAKRGETVQRISVAEKVAGPQFQDWLHFKNEREGSDIYVGMNVLKSNASTRTKNDILSIRHLYVDLDHHGSASLNAIERSALTPPPNYVLNTSPNKYQAIWKVEDIEITHAEALLHALAREFGGDPAATDASRVLRVPGFLNKKYDEDFLVTVRHHSDRVYDAHDFKVRTEPIDSGYRQPHQSIRRQPRFGKRTITQSERDWAYVKSALAQGADAAELIAQLAQSRANDKSDPEYYARLTVTKALAELELSKGHRDDGPASNRSRETEH